MRKKIFILIVVGILFLGSLGSIAISNENIKQEKINIYFSQLSIYENEGSITLELEGANSVLMRKDHYMVPIYEQTFTYPLGTKIKNINCYPEKINSQILTKKIKLAPEPVVISAAYQDVNNQGNLNPKVFDLWYDYSIGAGLNGNTRCLFVKVEVYPVKYNPLKSTVDWAESIKIEIKYENPQQFIGSFEDDYELIVLTHDDFIDELSSLRTHKINRDISTKIVTLNDIYSGIFFSVQGRDDQEKIKYFIKNAYDHWGTTDVLIVGGSTEFPTRKTHIKVSNSDEEIFVSDLYYADIYDSEGNFSSWDSNSNDVFAEYNWGDEHNYDDLDLYPDVRLGRLACTSSQEVTTCVNKIKNYENARAWTQNWFSNIVVIGGDTAPNDNQGIDEGEHLNQAVLDVMDGFIPDIIWDSNGRLGGISPSGVTNINNGINRGCGFVDWSGHGAPTVWTTYPHNGSKQKLPSPYPPGNYYSRYNNDLTNGDKLPIVMNGGCSLGKFNVHDNCFAWSYLSNPDGGGIASIGSTGLGYIYVGKYVTYGLVEGFMLKMFEAYDDGAITFGEMWIRAVNDYISVDMGGGDYKTITELEPFGDPTLAIAEESLAPLKPETPNGPGSGSSDESYTYTTSSSDPDGDKISYLFDWGDGTYSEWTSLKFSGQETSESHSWKSRGTFQVKVQAKDEHGVKSEWSDPLQVSMPKNKAIDLFIIIIERFVQRFPLLEQLLK
jgi:hypothetical protein